jgi:hypothetical protein
MTCLKKYQTENKQVLDSIKRHTPKKIWEDMPFEDSLYTAEQLRAVEIAVCYFHKHIGKFWELNK